MSVSADRNASAVEQMRRKWEKLACEDPMYWIASGRTDWTLEDFYTDDHWYDGRTIGEFLAEVGVDLRGRRVLDIGCGMGRIAVHFRRYGAEVYGTDISEEMIRLARLNLAHDPGMHFDVGDGSTLSGYADCFFDVVWSYITFRHIPSLDVIRCYLREIGRVLKPAGRFVIEVGHFRGWQCFVEPDRALRIGLRSSARLGGLGIRALPTAGLVRYDAFAGVRVPRRFMLKALADGGLTAERSFTYDPNDHMFYSGSKSGAAGTPGRSLSGRPEGTRAGAS